MVDNRDLSFIAFCLFVTLGGTIKNKAVSIRLSGGWKQLMKLGSPMATRKLGDFDSGTVAPDFPIGHGAGLSKQLANQADKLTAFKRQKPKTLKKYRGTPFRLQLLTWIPRYIRL